MTTNKPTLYPHQQELIEQAALSAADLEQQAKRQAYIDADLRHEIKHHQSGKTFMLQSMAANAALQTLISSGKITVIDGDEVTINAFDPASDHDDLMEAMGLVIDSIEQPEPVYLQQLGRAKRIPMEETYNDTVGEVQSKAGYLAYNTQSPKGRQGANTGKAEKALAKRRAANKVARKARRK